MGSGNVNVCNVFIGKSLEGNKGGIETVCGKQVEELEKQKKSGRMAGIRRVNTKEVVRRKTGSGVAKLFNKVHMQYRKYNGSNPGMRVRARKRTMPYAMRGRENKRK